MEILVKVECLCLQLRGSQNEKSNRKMRKKYLRADKNINLEIQKRTINLNNKIITKTVESYPSKTMSMKDKY